MPQDNGTATLDSEQALRDQYEYAPPVDDLSLVGNHAPMNMPEGQQQRVNAAGRAIDSTGRFVGEPETLSPTSGIPARLITEAVKFGIEDYAALSAAELREAIRDAKLDLVLSSRESSERSTVHDALGRGTGSSPASGAQTPAGAVVTANETESVIDWGEGTDGAKLEEKDWPKPVAAAFRQAAQVPALLKRLETLEKGHAEVHQYVTGERTQKFVSEVDQGFADAGPQFARIIGKGAGNDMEAESPEMGVRLAVLASLKANPIPKLSAAKAIAKRTQQLFGHLAGPAPEPEQQTLTPKPPAGGGRIPVNHNRIADDAWQAGNTASPNGRRLPKPPAGPKAAVDAVAQYLQTHDMGGNAEDPEMPE